MHLPCWRTLPALPWVHGEIQLWFSILKKHCGVKKFSPKTDTINKMCHLGLQHRMISHRKIIASLLEKKKTNHLFSKLPLALHRALLPQCYYSNAVQRRKNNGVHYHGAYMHISSCYLPWHGRRAGLDWCWETKSQVIDVCPKSNHGTRASRMLQLRVHEEPLAWLYAWQWDPGCQLGMEQNKPRTRSWGFTLLLQQLPSPWIIQE